VAFVSDAPPWQAQATPAADVPVADLPPFVRGHEACFDAWRDAGNAGWGYADVLPAFRRVERYEAGASPTRGADGPLSVMHCWDPHAAHRAFLMACVPSGFRQDSRHDFNGPRSQGVAGYYQKAILDDRPHTLEAAFLGPARARPGVTVVTGGYATRVVMEGTRAVGVEYAVGEVRTILRATKGVIVGADPARAAQLLMLSGIGPAAALRALSLPVVADRPGVGRNLHDQLRLELRWQARQAVPPSSVTAGMFTVSLHASPPDLQMDFVEPGTAHPGVLGLDVTLVRPASRGELRLTSGRPEDAPVLSLNPLATDGDLTALVQGVRLGRLIMSGTSLDAFRGDEGAVSRDARSEAELQTLVRAAASPRGYLAGTCLMGPARNPAAVVDATLAVHGVDGLRVAGAAVMPDVVNAPPEAASLMIGERCAELVLRGAAA
jgi:choline dehydrogenase